MVLYLLFKRNLKFFLIAIALEWFIEQWDNPVFEGLVEFLCETIWAWHFGDSSLIIFLIRKLPYWSCLTLLGLILYFPKKLPISLKFSNLLHRGLQSSLFKFLMFQWLSLVFLILNIYAFFCLLFINLANGGFVLYHISIMNEKFIVFALWSLCASLI